jgi:hypothetical protein
MKSLHLILKRLSDPDAELEDMDRPEGNNRKLVKIVNT